jgi:hypothetical protein
MAHGWVWYVKPEQTQEKPRHLAGCSQRSGQTHLAMNNRRNSVIQVVTMAETKVFIVTRFHGGCREQCRGNAPGRNDKPTPFTSRRKDGETQKSTQNVQLSKDITGSILKAQGGHRNFLQVLGHRLHFMDVRHGRQLIAHVHLVQVQSKLPLLMQSVADFTTAIGSGGSQTERARHQDVVWQVLHRVLTCHTATTRSNTEPGKHTSTLWRNARNGGGW